MTAIVTVGVCPGYFSDGKSDISINEFTKRVMEITAKIASTISWNITLGRVAYNKDWDCPEDGEPMFTLSSDYTNYDKPYLFDHWQENIIKCAKQFKEEFQQQTVRVTFFNNTNTTII